MAQVFHDDKTVIDFTFTDEAGVVRSQVYRQTLDEIRERHPDARLGDLDEAYAKIEDSYRVPPVEITEDHFIEMLEVLPPVKWRRTQEAETFMLSERMYGDITSIFCRIGSRYFEMQDHTWLDIDEIVARCSEVSA